MMPVSKCWPGATFVLLGGGPSLTEADVNAIKWRVRMRVIAINDAVRLASWADVLYAADARWWSHHNGVPSFKGPKFSIDAPNDPVKWPDVQVLANTGLVGLELDPAGLRAGFNSGYQAINLAVHLGAARILLLGYDMSLAADGKSHWFGEHPQGWPASPYEQMREAFNTLVEPLQEIGVEVVNCSRRTALTAFRCASLDDELARLERAA